MDKPPSDQEATAARIAVTVLFAAIGLGATYWSWSTAHKSGYFYPELAMLGPAFCVVAAYYTLVHEDPRRLPSPIPVRLWVTVVLALLAGGANWFALSRGLY